MRRALLALRSRRGCSRARRRAARRRHPLGNFSINHLTRVSVVARRASTSATSSTRPRSRRSRSAALAARARCSRASAPRSLRAARARPSTGGASPLAPRRRRGSRFPPGQGGLPTDPRRAARCTARGRRRAAHGARCTTARSPAASAGRRSSPRPGRGHGGALDAPGRATRPTGCATTRRTCCRARSTQRDATLAVARRQRHGHRAARRRAPASTTERPARATASPGCSRRGAGGRAAAPAARRVRLGRAARALPRARQGDGRRLPGRHARHGAARGRARRAP